MSDNTIPSVPKSRAEALFKVEKLLGAVDVKRQAVEEAKVAEVEKTSRLRALRLAKEKVDQIAAAVQKTSPKRKR